MHHTADRLNPLVEPAILYFHRKGVARAEWDDMVMHLEADKEGHVGSTPGEINRAIMFIDLANFTPLAEAMGDERAAAILERFSEIVRFANIRCHGRIVKQIGDAFMVVFPEPYSAVSCALEVESKVSKEPHFPPVRAGLHWGSVLYREADYVGSNVNIASRLGAEANRHQVLITGEVWRRAKDLPGAEFNRLGKRKLKGIAREIEVYEVSPAGREALNRETDPVCGMELGPGEAAARLTIDGVERAFCSDDCLRKFVKDPQQYSLAVV
jgi:adenylate cyclase